LGGGVVFIPPFLCRRGLEDFTRRDGGAGKKNTFANRRRLDTNKKQTNLGGRGAQTGPQSFFFQRGIISIGKRTQSFFFGVLDGGGRWKFFLLPGAKPHGPGKASACRPRFGLTGAKTRRFLSMEVRPLLRGGEWRGKTDCPGVGQIEKKSGHGKLPFSPHQGPRKIQRGREKLRVWAGPPGFLGGGEQTANNSVAAIFCFSKARTHSEKRYGAFRPPKWHAGGTTDGMLRGARILFGGFGISRPGGERYGRVPKKKHSGTGRGGPRESHVKFRGRGQTGGPRLENFLFCFF